MSNAKQYNFSIERGSSFRIVFTHKDENNNPINITGWCARLVLKTHDGEVYDFNTSNTNYSQYKFSTDGPSGTMSLMIPASTTNNFDFVQGKYDLELQLPEELYAGSGPKIIRILYGTINVVSRFSNTLDILSC